MLNQVMAQGAKHVDHYQRGKQVSDDLVRVLEQLVHRTILALVDRRQRDAEQIAGERIAECARERLAGQRAGKHQHIERDVRGPGGVSLPCLPL